MKSAVFFLAILAAFEVSSQTLNLTFNNDGSYLVEHVNTDGTSKQYVDAQNRITQMDHYFPGGKRMRMFDKYIYDDDMLVEHIAYIYTTGYERETFRYDDRGNELEYHHYASQSEGNWELNGHRVREYDARNNPTYWKTNTTQFGDLIHTVSRFRYDYNARKYHETQETYDENNRLISTENNTINMADWQLNGGKPFVFDIKKTGPHLRDNRVILYKTKDGNGNQVEKTFVNHYVLTNVFDHNGRVIRMVKGWYAGSDNDGDNSQYSDDEIVEFTYNSQGRLIEIHSSHYDLPREKWTFTHVSETNIKAKHYRMNKNGSFALVEEKLLKSVASFTPKARPSNHEVVQNDPPVSYEDYDEYVEHDEQDAPSESEYVPKPTYSQNAGSGSIVEDLTETNPSGSKETLKVYSNDAEKLAHIAKIISHSTGIEVGEEEVMALALQLLVEKYQVDLKEMNTAYLENKETMFD